MYIGSTLWGSYITKTFEACARRMGPMMAVGGMKEEKCTERGAIGPYPYAVGMLQVLSHQVASWMVEQPNFAEFEQRATAATGTKRRPDGTPFNACKGGNYKGFFHVPRALLYALRSAERQGVRVEL